MNDALLKNLEKERKGMSRLNRKRLRKKKSTFIDHNDYGLYDSYRIVKNNNNKKEKNNEK